MAVVRVHRMRLSKHSKGWLCYWKHICISDASRVRCMRVVKAIVELGELGVVEGKRGLEGGSRSEICVPIRLLERDEQDDERGIDALFDPETSMTRLSSEKT